MEPARILSTMIPNTGQGQQALHGGHIAGIHHLGGILQIALLGEPQGQEVPDESQIEAEEAQHQPALLPELPGPAGTAHTIVRPTSPVMGNIQVAATSTTPVTRLVSRKGPFFRTLATISMNTGPNQDGVNKVGGKPHIGTDAAYQHKDKADGDAHRSQRAGGDGVLCCQFLFSLFQ